jgi:hypothetical protein
MGADQLLRRLGTEMPNPDRVLHYEHPDQNRASWCGAPVQGIYKPGTVECPECERLWQEWLKANADEEIE